MSIKDEVQEELRLKKVSKELRDWFLETIEVAVQLDAKANNKAPYQRFSVDPDQGPIYVGDGGEFEVTLTVTPL